MDIGGKGVFVKELEQELLNGGVDIAVHSLKDMPAKITEGLSIGAFLTAEDKRDALVSLGKKRLEQLPDGARIGTGSPRRRMQLSLLRPDLKAVPIRGNVDTRVTRVENGECDAAVLASAGLKRLGLRDKITEIFSPYDMVPAPGQGVIAAEARCDDRETADILEKIDDISQRIISVIEFGVLQGLNADCKTPIGMNSFLDGNRITLNIFLSNEAGSHHIKKTFKTTIDDKDSTVGRLLENIRAEWKKVTGKEL